MDGYKMWRLEDRLQAIREAKGETQQALADNLGVSRELVKAWEAGTRSIKTANLIALADHYDCTIDFIVGRSDNPTRDKNMQEICEYTGLSEWSVKVLHSCKNDPERKDHVETINALLEDEDSFYSMADDVTSAAKAKTLWRMIHDAGINISDPDYWNEANSVLTIGNVATKEYSPFNYAELPGEQNVQVLLPAGSWFLTADDAADFFVNRATELFRDVITAHIEKWIVWPDLFFSPGKDGKTQVTINEDNTEAQNGQHTED